MANMRAMLTAALGYILVAHAALYCLLLPATNQYTGIALAITVSITIMMALICGLINYRIRQIQMDIWRRIGNSYAATVRTVAVTPHESELESRWGQAEGAVIYWSMLMLLLVCVLLPLCGVLNLLTPLPMTWLSLIILGVAVGCWIMSHRKWRLRNQIDAEHTRLELRSMR
jgi:hypothetical protein